MKFAVLIGAILVQATPATAQEKPPVPAIMKSLIDCRSLADGGARLRCYDQQVGSVEQATASGALVVLDREAVKRTRRSLFGFDLPSLPFFQSDKDDGEEPKEITAIVKSARPAGYENWLILLDSGESWQTTEATPRAPIPRAGDEVKIRKTMTGGYMLRVGMRSIRARRVR